MTVRRALSPLAVLFARTMILRLPLALVMVLWATLTWSTRLFREVRTGWPGPGYIDGISLFERRLDSIRPKLPAHGVVGYVPTVPNIDPNDPRRIELAQRLTLTQYSLAPLLVEPGQDHALVVVNSDRGVQLIQREER